MKFSVGVVILFLIFSCGKGTTYRFENIHIEPIREVQNDSVNCCLYEVSDSISTAHKKGVMFYFDLSYSGSSGSMAPGIKGTIDEILDISIALIHQKVKTEISSLLYNSEQCQITSMYKHPSLNHRGAEFRASEDHRCLCLDRSQNNYFEDVHSKYYNSWSRYRYKKDSTVFSYLSKEKDTVHTVYSSRLIDTTYYFYKNMAVLVNEMNRLTIKPNIERNTAHHLNSGAAIEVRNFNFWFPDSLDSLIVPGSKIRIECVLKDGRILQDEKVMR